MKTKKKSKITGTKWKDEYYLTIHELAKSGMPNTHIARSIGVKFLTLEKWIERRPALRVAIDKARKHNQGKAATQTFVEYVYEQLPEHLKEVWDEIDSLSNEKNAIRKIEFILEDQGQKVRQHLFMHALIHCNFNISKACGKVNVSRKKFNYWLYNDPDFAELIEEMQFHKKNFFEAALVGLVHAGDPAATIFVNKTLNRDRGYAEKVEVTGSIEHNHVVTVDSLNLPIEVRQQVLDAMRAKRTIEVTPQKHIESTPQKNDDDDE